MNRIFLSLALAAFSFIATSVFANSETTAPAAVHCIPSEEMGNVFYNTEYNGDSIVLDCTGVTFLRCDNHVVCCSKSYLASELRFDPQQCATIEWLNPSK